MEEIAKLLIFEPELLSQVNNLMELWDLEPVSVLDLQNFIKPDEQ